jgi:tRNA(Ile)-lysidine synthase
MMIRHTLAQTLAATAAGLMLCLAGPALSQTPIESDPLNDRSVRRLDNMEKVMRELRSIVFQARNTGKPVVIQSAETESVVQTLTQRVDDLELSLRRMTGDSETLVRDLEQARRDLTAERERAAALESRLTALESRVAAGAPPPPADAGSGILGTLPAGAAPAAGPPAQTPAAAFAAANTLLLEGDYAGAESAFSAFLERYPDHARSPEANYRLGRLYLRDPRLPQDGVGARCDAGTVPVAGDAWRHGQRLSGAQRPGQSLSDGAGACEIPRGDHARPGPVRLEAQVFAVLGQRLAKESRRPLAVALSGGGDSLALLILTLGWAQATGRLVHALVFDHGLNPHSADWTRFALETAGRLGAKPLALQWAGAKPASGIPAAARTARHAALADAAREAGAAVLLMGHTADDRLEAELMRREGSSVSDPQVWSPSPAWPQGRGVFLLRPLLDVRRADLRRYLSSLGEVWIDDPANDDPRFARARARRRASEQVAAVPAPAATFTAIDGWRESFGVLEATGDVTPLALSAACLCASGTASPPAGAALRRLLALAESGADFTSTLAGARVQRRSGALTVTRETGRTPPAPISLTAGRTIVWDGRFEITTGLDAKGLTARALGGLASRLPKVQRDALTGVPAAARPTLPVLVDEGGSVTCPVLAGTAQAGTAVSLVMDRFLAACGRIAAEPA